MLNGNVDAVHIIGWLVFVMLTGFFFKIGEVLATTLFIFIEKRIAE